MRSMSCHSPAYSFVVVALVDDLDLAGLEVGPLDDVAGTRRRAAVSAFRVNRVRRGVLDGQRVALDGVRVEVLVRELL